MRAMAKEYHDIIEDSGDPIQSARYFQMLGLSGLNVELGMGRMVGSITGKEPSCEFTTVYAAASYQAALDRLADRMNAEMMIEYLVPVGSTPRDVKVGIKIIGARVRGLGVAPK